MILDLTSREERKANRDKMVIQYLKSGGKIYYDDYSLFGFDSNTSFVRYLNGLQKNGIIKYYIDGSLKKYCLIK